MLQTIASDADVWDLSFYWSSVKHDIQQSLLRGQYRFAPMSRVRKANGEVIHIWSSRDALVLKALAIVLAQHLPVSGRCTHVKGHGGAKATVRAVRDQLPKHAFVMRTDVKSYYASIDHQRMLDLLAAHINDRAILNLLWQVMHRSVTWGGLSPGSVAGVSSHI